MKELNEVSAYYNLGRLYTYQGNYKDAIAAIQKVSEESTYLGYIYAISGEHDKARQILNKHIEIQKARYDPNEKESIRHWIKSLKIDHYYQDFELEQLIQNFEEQFSIEWLLVTGVSMRIYTGLGDYDKVFEMFETCYRFRAPGLLGIMTYAPEFDPIRSDPRFTVLLKKIGLPTE